MADTLFQIKFNAKRQSASREPHGICSKYHPLKFVYPGIKISECFPCGNLLIDATLTSKVGYLLLSFLSS